MTPLSVREGREKRLGIVPVAGCDTVLQALEGELKIGGVMSAR